jgi:hypothetical protein
MSGIAIHPITISALQHISAFGPCTLDAMRAAVAAVVQEHGMGRVRHG